MRKDKQKDLKLKRKTVRASKRLHDTVMMLVNKRLVNVIH
jgi:hypothetical protein